MNAALVPWMAVLALAGTLGAVVALYLVHPPARRLIVSSTLVWERVLRGPRRRQDRLRWWLSLLLAAAIALLLATALIRHHLQAGAVARDRPVIVLDNSLTMAVRTSDGMTRFAHAVAGARALLLALPAGAEAMVVDTQRTIPLPRFEPREEALASLGRVRVDPGLVPRFTVPVLQTGAAVHVFTDGVLLRDWPAEAQVHSVFDPVENMGITRFEVRAVPGQPGRQEAFVEVSNAGGGSRQVQVTLGSAKGIHQRTFLFVPGGGKETLTLDASLAESGPLRIGLVNPGDGLALDDAVYAYLPRRARVRLTLVTAANPFLEKALAAQPDVRLRVVAPASFRESGEVDLYVFDRHTPSRAPAAPALLIGGGAWDGLELRANQRIAPQVAGWDTHHPVLRQLSLRDLQIRRAASAQVQDRATRVVLHGQDGEPLIAVREREPRRVWLAFSLADSNFGLQADFPMFLGNAITWLTTQAAVLSRGVGVVDLPLLGAKVIGLDGASLPVTHAGSNLRFDAREPGIYTALAEGGSTIVTVNLLSDRVTRINDSLLAPMQPETLRRASSAAFDPLPLLLVIALALLMLEWVTYHRRLTV